MLGPVVCFGTAFGWSCGAPPTSGELPDCQKYTWLGSKLFSRRSACAHLVRVPALNGAMAPTHNKVLAMGVLLGIAGGSFGVALSLGSG